MAQATNLCPFVTSASVSPHEEGGQRGIVTTYYLQGGGLSKAGFNRFSAYLQHPKLPDVQLALEEIRAVAPAEPLRTCKHTTKPAPQPFKYQNLPAELKQDGILCFNASSSVKGQLLLVLCLVYDTPSEGMPPELDWCDTKFQHASKAVCWELVSRPHCQSCFNKGRQQDPVLRASSKKQETSPQICHVAICEASSHVTRPSTSRADSKFRCITAILERTDEQLVLLATSVSLQIESIANNDAPKGYAMINTPLLIPREWARWSGVEPSAEPLLAPSSGQTKGAKAAGPSAASTSKRPHAAKAAARPAKQSRAKPPGRLRGCQLQSPSSDSDYSPSEGSRSRALQQRSPRLTRRRAAGLPAQRSLYAQPEDLPPAQHQLSLPDPPASREMLWLPAKPSQHGISRLQPLPAFRQLPECQGLHAVTETQKEMLWQFEEPGLGPEQPNTGQSHPAPRCVLHVSQCLARDPLSSLEQSSPYFSFQADGARLQDIPSQASNSCAASSHDVTRSLAGHAAAAQAPAGMPEHTACHGGHSMQNSHGSAAISQQPVSGSLGELTPDRVQPATPDLQSLLQLPGQPAAWSGTTGHAIGTSCTALRGDEDLVPQVPLLPVAWPESDDFNPQHGPEMSVDAWCCLNGIKCQGEYWEADFDFGNPDNDPADVKKHVEQFRQTQAM